MDSTKYIGMDVHKDAMAVAVMNSAGKVVMECILETKAATILQFVRGLRGNLLVTLEEGTWAAWLYDLLKPYVSQVTVCNPRRNALLKSGNKGDRIDARKLAELLRHGSLSLVYHGEKDLRTLKELSRSYLTLNKDLTRVMNRLKCTTAGAFPAAVRKSMHPGIGRNGWARSRKQGCAAEQSSPTTSSMDCRCYAGRCGGNCWPRAGNIGQRNCCTRFRVSAPSGRRTWWRSFRPPTGFARSAKCGPTAASRSRSTAAGNIVT